MRTTLALGFVVLTATSAGCSENCGLGNQINNLVYDAFIHPIGPWNITNADAFPAEASPGNGPLEFQIEWGATNQGPITVFMDGQSFDGDGVFFEQECGNIEIVWSGKYVSDVGSEHNFGARAQLQFYQGVIAGRVTRYSETWSYRDEVGSYSAEASDLFGESQAAGAQ